ncbi:MAG: hypothetical protein JO352_11935 [Chloroflexi bacterium]|nr:hypothetical protein [Chloroflexota bacterium]MBV9597566.1 hypothetical protein [Chloroflexota bacterium]
MTLPLGETRGCLHGFRNRALTQGGSYSYAFELSLAQFVVLLLGVAGLSRLLPRESRA